MNARNPVVRFLLFPMLLLASLSVLASTPSPSILANGGFESPNQGEDGPAGWKTTNVRHTKELHTFAWDDQVFRTGTRSVSLAIDQDHPDQQIHYNWNALVLNFTPGATYEVSGWVKTENTPDAPFLLVQCWDGSMKEMLAISVTESESPMTGTVDWTKVKTSIAVPEKAVRIMILAGLGSPQNRGGKVWFDDVKMIRTDSD